MEQVRNNDNKLVCLIDKKNRTVEIVVKACKTVIIFMDKETVKIINEKR